MVYSTWTINIYLKKVMCVLKKEKLCSKKVIYVLEKLYMF